MAKLSLTALKTAVASIVTAVKLSNATFSVTRDNIVGLVDKIGKIVTLDTVYSIDKLAKFDGEYLSYGKTIEDWQQDLIMPVAYDATASPYGNYKPSYRPPYYSYTLGKKIIPTTIPNNDVERAVHFEAQLAGIVAMQVKRLSDSMAVYRYQLKKEMLANLANMAYASNTLAKSFSTSTAFSAGDIVKNSTSIGFVNTNIASSNTSTYSQLVTAGTITDITTSVNGAGAAAKAWASGALTVGEFVNLTGGGVSRSAVVVKAFTSTGNDATTFNAAIAAGNIVELNLFSRLALPVATSSADAFIKQVKKDVEIAGDISEGHSLNGNTLGATEGLTLIVKQGVMPVVEVDNEAGAFHLDKVAIPADVIVVNDIPTADTGVYAVLIDSRGMRLHNTYDATRENLNGAADWLNLFRHTEDTAYISRNTFVKVYTATGAV